MPSASSKSASMASQVPSLEGQDPLKVVVSMMEKKVRNLEKRKTRLVAYTQQVEEGKELIEKDQLDAVKKLEFVDNSLELAKEFHQIFRMMEQEHLKLQKKEQKRTKVELKEKSNEVRHKLVYQVLEVQTLLENLDDEAKEDFLNGTNGACKLEQGDFVKLDGIYKLITPNQNEDSKLMKEQVTAATTHLHNLLDEKDKPVLDSTYKEVSGIITKVKDSKYFEKSDEAEEEEVSEEKASSEKDEVVESRQPVQEETEDDSAEEERVGEDASRGAEVDSDNSPDVNKADVLEQEDSTGHPVPPLVNGVDLPVEFSEAAADSALNFMGESEFQMAESSSEPTEEGKLNAASPEFIPRSLQSGGSQPDTAADSAGWEESESPEVTENTASDNYGWQDVTSSGDGHQHSHGNRSRNAPRGRGDRGGYRGGREGRGGRGRGGYGQNGSNYQRQERSDNYQRREGGNRGGRPRGGHPRGGRGDSRGAPRGSASRGGGFNRPQQQ